MVIPTVGLSDLRVSSTTVRVGLSRDMKGWVGSPTLGVEGLVPTVSDPDTLQGSQTVTPSSTRSGPVLLVVRRSRTPSARVLFPFTGGRTLGRPGSTTDEKSSPGSTVVRVRQEEGQVNEQTRLILLLPREGVNVVTRSLTSLR